MEFITEGDEQDLKEGKPNLVAAVKVCYLPARLHHSQAAAPHVLRTSSCDMCAKLGKHTAPHQPCHLAPRLVHTIATHPSVQAIFSAGNFTPSNGAGVLFRLVPNW